MGHTTKTLNQADIDIQDLSIFGNKSGGVLRAESTALLFRASATMQWLTQLVRDAQPERAALSAKIVELERKCADLSDAEATIATQRLTIKRLQQEKDRFFNQTLEHQWKSGDLPPAFAFQPTFDKMRKTISDQRAAIKEAIEANKMLVARVALARNLLEDEHEPSAEH